MLVVFEVHLAPGVALDRYAVVRPVATSISNFGRKSASGSAVEELNN